jgi:hypothetical protein
MTKILKFLVQMSAFAAVVSIADTAMAATAADTQSKKIENVLDKLEKKLIDRESSPFTEEEDLSLKSQQTDKGSAAKQTYEPKSPGKIKAGTPSGKNLSEIQKRINEYDGRLEVLESDLRRLRAGVYEGSVTDNQIMLNVKTANDAKHIIRTLTTRLDGNTLYNQMDPAGLWMPAREIPIFYGPLQPGEHRIDLSATIAPTTSEGIELPTWQHKSVQQSFSFTVPDGKARKNIVIEISDPKSSGSHPVAKLVEEDRK